MTSPDKAVRPAPTPDKAVRPAPPDKDQDALLPCPFCGGADILGLPTYSHETAVVAYRCADCGAQATVRAWRQRVATNPGSDRPCASTPTPHQGQDASPSYHVELNYRRALALDAIGAIPVQTIGDPNGAHVQVIDAGMVARLLLKVQAEVEAIVRRHSAAAPARPAPAPLPEGQPVSNADELPAPNHEEAEQFAYLHRGDSNLARAYLDLLDRRSPFHVPAATPAAPTLRGLAPAAPVDVSPDWRGSTRRERRILMDLVKLEATPKAIVRFARDCDHLSDYWYWFTLGTLWVSYSSHSDLGLWKRLFSAPRPNRATSLMKPSELQQLIGLPEYFRAYRAHRRGEKDWIAYTLDQQKAAMFARQREVDIVAEYAVQKRDVLALFTRRGEAEVIVINRLMPVRIGELEVLVWPDETRG